MDDDERPVHDPDHTPGRTGVDRVDAVLDAVAALGEEPVSDQVAVFEHAHSELRATLDDPDGAGPHPDPV